MMHEKHSLAERKKMRKAYQEAAKKYPVGEGHRFEAMMKVAKTGGATEPAAVAAYVGRKKYGQKKFKAMAVAGRKRK